MYKVIVNLVHIYYTVNKEIALWTIKIAVVDCTMATDVHEPFTTAPNNWFINNLIVC